MAAKLVYILWVNSCSPSDSSWHRKDELTLQPLKCETVGYVIAEDAGQISIASCIMENGQVYGVITIPKCSILKRRRVS